jgi:hypothetical protein
MNRISNPEYGTNANMVKKKMVAGNSAMKKLNAIALAFMLISLELICFQRILTTNPNGTCLKKGIWMEPNHLKNFLEAAIILIQNKESMPLKENQEQPWISGFPCLRKPKLPWL